MSSVEDRFRFEDEPSEGDENHEWSIVRAPSEGIMTLVCVSAMYRGARTHYFRGRTGPCAKQGCLACLAHQTSRWNGYLLAVVTGSQDHVIFEFTPPARLPLKRVHEEVGTLRGQVLVVSRTSKKTNGKVNVITKGLHPNAGKLPHDMPITPLLCRIWGVDGANLLPFDGLSDDDRRNDGPSDRYNAILNSDAERGQVEQLLEASAADRLKTRAILESTAAALNGRSPRK